MKWEKIKLGDAASFINGYAFKPSDWENDGKEIIRIQNLTGSSKKANYYSGTIADKYLVKKGDILIAWSATLGVFEWEKQDGWLNQHIFKVVFDKAEFDKSFFKYLIEHKLEEMKRSVHGATMKHITKKRFESLQIPLPPLSEQRRLAARLDQADAVRQKSRALVDVYAELGRSVFLEVFGDPVRNERGWEVVALKDVATINPRKNLDDIEPSSKVDFIGMANVSDISKQLIEVEQKPLSAVTKGYTFIPNQSVILAKITPCFENGKVAIADLDTVIGFGSTEFHVVIPQERITKEFIKYVFMSESFLQKGVTQMTGSAGQKRIPTSFLKKLQIPLPPLPLQTRFAAMVANIEAQRRLAERQLKAAEAVFGGVLQGTFER